MMARYSDEQKALALEVVARNNGVLDTYSMDAIRAALEAPNLPDQTVRLWMRNYQSLQSRTESRVKLTDKKAIDSPPSATVTKDDNRLALQEMASEKLDVMLERAARMMVAKATEPAKIADMTGQQLMTSAGIAIDKMRLLRDQPTEIVANAATLLEINQYAVALGITLAEVLTRLSENMKAEADADSVIEVQP